MRRLLSGGMIQLIQPMLSSIVFVSRVLRDKCHPVPAFGSPTTMRRLSSAVGRSVSITSKAARMSCKRRQSLKHIICCRREGWV